MHPNDVFYECNGAGACGTPEHYVPGQQWALNKVGTPQAWKYTTGSHKVKVRSSCHAPGKATHVFVQQCAVPHHSSCVWDDGAWLAAV